MKLFSKIRKRWEKWNEERYSVAKTIYFNFHYLPFNQACKLPILLRNVRFKDLRGKIVIDAEEIRKGMIQIGKRGRNFWCPNDVSTIDMRGGKLIFVGGQIRFRQGAHIKVSKRGLMEINRGFTAASNCNLVCFYHIFIGENTHLGWDVTLMDTNWHKLKDIYSNSNLKMFAAVRIGANCWIGAKSSIMQGTILADNTIVSYGSIVNTRIKDQYKLLGGNPARIIGEGYAIDEETFNELPVVPKELIRKRKSKYNNI